MRNEPVALDRTDAMRAYAVRETLESLSEDEVVTLEYFKRDGSESSSTGVVRYFNGREGCDTMSVTLDTPDKGMRTINLNKVTRIS
jgi:hypothetical protein